MIHGLAEAAGRDVPRETFEKLEDYAAQVRAESKQQNLVAASTLDHLWDRHILDSAQLARFEPFDGASWCDIGSGAGLPGIVLACLVSGPVALIEPRRLRADFLHRVVESLDLNARVLCAKVERVEGTFDVITARAVARLGRLLEISAHLSTRKTVWALPKGRSAREELAEAQRAWQGVFHVERSVTDADSYIVVGTGVRMRA
ncbi:MAG TPA: 16S rRNA (guanine(527)-N(7))-methyltransferase RsmG [Sphingomicrobium sp.]|nr:16S rRNA (guanine(527)-N(7))-methyltransferase RsmG [Sphingomicrobium sp.]